MFVSLCFWPFSQSSQPFSPILITDGDRAGARVASWFPVNLLPFHSMPIYPPLNLNRLESSFSSDTSSFEGEMERSVLLRSIDLGPLSISCVNLFHRISSPEKNGGIDLISIVVPLLDNLFCQMGPNPTLFSLRPNSRWCPPNIYLQKPRFLLLLPLLLLRQILCRFMKTIVSGRRLDSNQTELLGWCNLCSRNWPLDSSRRVNLNFQSLQKTFPDFSLCQGQLKSLRKCGIMISSLQRVDYRNFLNPLWSYPLFTELKDVQFFNISEYPHLLNSVKFRSVYPIYVSSRLRTLCRFLNLYGIRYARENIHVMLRLYNRCLRSLMLTSLSILSYDLVGLKGFVIQVGHFHYLSSLLGLGYAQLSTYNNPSKQSKA